MSVNDSGLHFNPRKEQKDETDVRILMLCINISPASYVMFQVAYCIHINITYFTFQGSTRNAKGGRVVFPSTAVF